MPTPVKLPPSSLLTSSRSFAGMYAECGSRSLSNFGSVSSVSSSMLRVSTYWLLMRLSTEVIFLSFTPTGIFVIKTLPTTMPIANDTAIIRGIDTIVQFVFLRLLSVSDIMCMCIGYDGLSPGRGLISLCGKTIHLNALNADTTKQLQSVLYAVQSGEYNPPYACLNDEF